MTGALGSVRERAPTLRVFSYLPNSRLAKATIAARLCGVAVEVRGAPGRDLARWLWDFDARPLEAEDTSADSVREARVGFAGTLHKTDAFLSAHPFGTVSAAFTRGTRTSAASSRRSRPRARSWWGALAHFARLCAHEAVAPDLGPYLERLDSRYERSPS